MHMKKYALSILAFFTLSLTGFAQINAVETFLVENDNLHKFFIYQSTLRMLNDGQNPDFNKLIKGIRKINLYVAEESAQVSASSYQHMIRDLSAEQFETLVSAKKDQMLINLMSKETGNSAYYVLAVTEGDDFALLEMDGELDLRYLKALENLNFTELRKIAGMEEGVPAREELHD